MKHIIITLFIAVFIVSCAGSASAQYNMGDKKQEKLHPDMGGGY